MSIAANINGVLRRVPAWPLYVLGVIPPAWFLYQGLTGGLGPEPIKALEHKLGELGLQMLIFTLAVSPIRNHLNINLIKFRRAIGLVTFFYIFCHLLVWLVLDVQILGQIWADIVKRPYITIGMLGFILMIPIAITSNNLSIRKLGPKSWKRLHQLTYASAILGGVHFVMLAKGFQIEPLLYLGAILALLAMRLKLPRLRAAFQS